MSNSMRLYFVGLVGILTDIGRGKMTNAVNNIPQVAVADIRDNVVLTDGMKPVNLNILSTYGRTASIAYDVQYQRSDPIAIDDENDFRKPPSEPWVDSIRDP
jgi:hypothetical protein